MQYRVDNKSGNEVSVLGFGCMRFPQSMGRIDLKKTEELVVAAVDAGINYFDTAYLYPGNEEALGKVVKKCDLRERINIATKLPFSQCQGYEDFERLFKIQKERLQTAYIDYYFIHCIGTLEQWQHLCELGIERWIDEKKTSGEIRRIGFSFHGLKDEFTAILDAYDWQFCQIQYNYLNINYQAGVDGLKAAAAKNVPVFIMEPLLGGKLANGLPDKAVELFREKNSGWSPAAWALNWLWNQPEVTMLLSGMNEMAQLEENLQLADKAQVGMMSTEEVATIESVIKIVSESYKVPCTECNYCMPCPKGINIPGAFAAYNASYAMGRVTGLSQHVLGIGGMGNDDTHFVSDCIACKKCEKHCPQNIEISKELKQVGKRLESFWLRPLLAIARKCLGVKRRK